MAAVSGGMASLGLPHTYMPTLPVRIPDDNIAYCRSQVEAPLTALVGVVADGRQPEKFRELSRYRVRKLVGLTNRWRQPESLGSDLLGSSQAIRSIRLSFNRNLRNIITAENPRLTINLDMDGSYSFLKCFDRPHTTTGQEVVSQRLATSPCPLVPTTAHSRRSLASINSSSSLPPIKPFIPASARPPKPLDVFHYHARRMPKNGPDGVPMERHEHVLLQCLDTNWELHCPLLVKSKTLSSLLQTAGQPSPKKYYKTPVSRTLDEFISSSNIYSTEYQELASRGPPPEDVDIPQASELEHPKHFCESRVNTLTVIKLEIDDPLITPHAMAVALGNLYHEDTEVDIRDLAGVLAAAHVLQFEQLQKGPPAGRQYGMSISQQPLNRSLPNFQQLLLMSNEGKVESFSSFAYGCAKNMLRNIQSGTVCNFFAAATKYKEAELKNACVVWLELNLVPQLSMQIQLRQMTTDMLLQVLKSHRLFTYGEFSLYRVLAYWVFMQLNPQLQLMPSYNTILAFFNSLPKSSSLLEKDVGRQFMPLFTVLRLHGITDTRHLQDIQTMNILPQTWIVKILSQHYQALQSGGDMLLLKDFSSAAIRHGFIMDNEPHYHSEIISLFGFHFELKVVKLETKGAYTFLVQRLKPSDPVLSFRQCERHTFSMRPGRDTKYNIRVQYYSERRHYKVAETGTITRRFSLAEKTSMSEVSNFENLTAPMYVTFSLFFPPS